MQWSYIIGYEIEIIEGQDPSFYFGFRPVIVEKKKRIFWDEVVEPEEEFSIEEEDIRCFSIFFQKIFR